MNNDADQKVKMNTLFSDAVPKDEAWIVNDGETTCKITNVKPTDTELVFDEKVNWRELWMLKTPGGESYFHRIEDVGNQDWSICSIRKYIESEPAFTEIESLRAENSNLKSIIAKEMSENDEFGAEYVHVNILKAENAELKVKQENFCSEYRIKCDVETRLLHNKLTAATKQMENLSAALIDMNSWLDRMTQLKWKDSGYAPRFKRSYSKNKEALAQYKQFKKESV